ncbi:MAG: hypothetical protein KDD70_18795 [Bdellovibrionales bacterium]|nr:hypothetical protein [Bdellovibrionales bacterium]
MCRLLFLCLIVLLSSFSALAECRIQRSPQGAALLTIRDYAVARYVPGKLGLRLSTLAKSYKFTHVTHGEREAAEISGYFEAGNGAQLKTYTVRYGKFWAMVVQTKNGGWHYAVAKDKKIILCERGVGDEATIFQRMVGEMGASSVQSAQLVVSDPKQILRALGL